MQRPPVWSAWSPLWTTDRRHHEHAKWVGRCISGHRACGRAGPTVTTHRTLRSDPSYLAHCLVHADDHALPGRTRPAASSEVDDLIAEALALGEKSKPVPWAKGVLATRAWFRGDTIDGHPVDRRDAAL